jgi:AcrR family transcriptional regulator
VPADERRVRLRAERGANRAAIIASAEAALRRRPFREVSVEDVMQDAGLTRTQFYRHFDDLADLVLTVSAGAFEELLRSHERLAEVADFSATTLRAAIGPAVETFVALGPLVRAAGEAATHDAAVEAGFAAVHERYLALTARLVARAKEAGAPVGDPAQTARLLHLANVAYLTDTFGGEPRATREQAIEAITHVWAATLAVGAG